MFLNFQLFASYASYAILDYYLIQFLYYWFHRFIHTPSAGIFYRLHYIGHHKRDFPIRQLRKKSYSAEQGNGGWFQTGGELVFGIPILVISALCYYLISWPLFLIFEAILLLNVLLGEIMHSSFHLSRDASNHPESLAVHRGFYAYNWLDFKYYQHMHDLHHAYRVANFGFFDLTMDRLFGTWNMQVPRYLEILINSSQ